MHFTGPQLILKLQHHLRWIAAQQLVPRRWRISEASWALLTAAASECDVQALEAKTLLGLPFTVDAAQTEAFLLEFDEPSQS